VIPALYPAGLARPTQAVLGTLVLVVNLVAYGVLIRRLKGRSAALTYYVLHRPTPEVQCVPFADHRPRLLAACSGGRSAKSAAEGDSLTERQRDSILAQSRIPARAVSGGRCGLRFHNARIRATDSVSP